MTTAGSIRGNSKLKSLFVGFETDFNTSILTPADANRVPISEATWTPSQDFVERVVQLDVLGGVAGSIGGKGGKITFKYPLHGLGAANNHSAGAAATIGEPLATILLSACMKRIQQQGKLSDAAQAASPTALVLPSGAGASGKFGVGNSGAPFAATGSPLMVRAILASATSDSQTLAPPLSLKGSPVNLASGGGDEIYGGDCYYPDQTITADQAGTTQYCTFVGGGDGYFYEFTGCRGMLTKISGDAKKGAVAEFEFMVSSWTRTASSALAGQKMTNLHAQLIALGSPFFWKAAASASTPISGFEFDVGMAFATALSTEATDGNAGFVPTALKPALKVKPFLASSWATDFAAETQELIVLQVGSAAGRAMAIMIPYAQITKYPGETDQGGIIGHDVEFSGYNTIGTGPLAPFYIAFY